MKINSLVLVACALVTGCASNQPTQPTSKTYVIGDEKLLTPQSKEYKPTGREYVTATIIEVREFDLQGMPSGVVKDTASVTTKDVALISSGNMALLPAIAIAAAASALAGSVGNSIDIANAKTVGYEITYKIDGSEETRTAVERNLSFKPLPGARIKVTRTAFAYAISPL